MLVIQIEVIDGAWIVVNRNVPEKGDVGAVTGHLEVADMNDVGSCTYTTTTGQGKSAPCSG